jgi:hypothetical protein
MVKRSLWCWGFSNSSTRALASPFGKGRSRGTKWFLEPKSELLELLSGVRGLPVKESLSEEHKAVLLVIIDYCRKGGVSKTRVGEILGLDASSILDDLLSQGLIYCDPSRELSFWRPTHVGGGLEYRLLPISGFSARAENKSPLHAWGVKRYGPTGDSQSGCL